MMPALTVPRIAVVIPCYRVTRHIADVIAAVGPEVVRIYCVDDACPERSGAFIAQEIDDPRLVVVYNEVNRGVGGAVMAGYRRAVADGCDIVVKVDGDGQMDPRLIPKFVAPIVRGEADYTKGNRFYNLDDLHGMPPLRLFGNAVLSFLTKLSSGYWDVFDPTNGYTAIHAALLRELPLHKVAERYFFESDMLFRLNTLRAQVTDIPMKAVYADEKSSMVIHRLVGPFLVRNLVNLGKRLTYNYFLRNFNLASIEMLLGTGLVAYGTIFGTVHWNAEGVPATPGTVMLASLPIILGLQMLLAAFGYDVASVPRQAIHPRLVSPPLPRMSVLVDDD